MIKDLEAFTVRMERCRRKWNRRGIDYVLESAQILIAARKAAKEDRRWLHWLTQSAHMDRSTAFRHIRASHFLKSDVALMQHRASLSLTKVYALSRIERKRAIRFAKSPRIQAMPDVVFAQFIKKFLPAPKKRVTRPNVYRKIMANLNRIERAVRSLRRSRQTLHDDQHEKVTARIAALINTLLRMKKEAA